MAVEIIGRRDELLTLDAFLAAVPTGGQALLLEGDAGIGKTVLWQEALRVAGRSNVHVLRSRPTQSEAQVSFAAVGDLLGPTRGGVLQTLAPVQRRALETALLIREPEGMFPETRVLGLALLSVVRALSSGARRPHCARRCAVARRQLGGGAHVHAATAGRRTGGRPRDRARAAGQGAARTRPGLRGVPAASDPAALGGRDPSIAVGQVRDRRAAACDRAGARDHRWEPVLCARAGACSGRGFDPRRGRRRRAAREPARSRCRAVRRLARPRPGDTRGRSGARGPVDGIAGEAGRQQRRRHRTRPAPGGGRARWGTDSVHPSALGSRLLRGDAAAPKTPASQTPRGAGCRSRGARPPPRDRGNRPR